jgi:hypothetical protein
MATRKITALNRPTLMRFCCRSIRVHCLQIAVLSNHQSGKDTHMRQVKLFAPRNVLRSMRVKVTCFRQQECIASSGSNAASLNATAANEPQWSSLAFQMYSTVR